MGSIRLNDHPPVPAKPGLTLLDNMLDGGLPVLYLCMAGSCGRCRVRVQAGGEALGPRTRAEDHHHCQGDERLACQAQIVAEAPIEVRQ